MSRPKGFHLTEEHKRKIGLSNKGKIRSEETRKKISETNIRIGRRPPSTLGRKLSEEQKKKLSLSHKGKRPYIASDETKRKMSESHKLKPNRYWLGKKMSTEHKRKIGIKSKGRIPSINTRLKISKAHSGESHWNWKGGIEKLNRGIRSGIVYVLWRESVFARDNWTCQWCGKKGGKLNADHIKPFSKFPKKRFFISNGRTLCANCHKIRTNKQMKIIWKNQSKTSRHK